MSFSKLMEEYPSFSEFAKTRPSYRQIRDGITQNPNQISIESRLTLNLPQIRRDPWELPEPPSGWEALFDECRGDIEHSLEYINLQIAQGKKIAPSKEKLFRAFNYFLPHQTRVIIIGQDPYYTSGVANGLCFSFDGPKFQPSLVNVYKEIENSFGCRPPDGNLEFWAMQGVLLLNKCLTVNEGTAKSHGKAWDGFVHKILTLVLERVEFCFVCLWGTVAQSLFKGRNAIPYDQKRVKVLEAGHPSSMNTGKNPFVGCGHFVEINQVLINNGLPPIDWSGEYYYQHVAGR